MGFKNKKAGSVVFGAVVASMLSTSAFGGGFDRGGVNIDQLFDTDRFNVGANVRFVRPFREFKNIVRESNVAVPLGIAGAIAASPAGAAVGAILGTADTATIVGAIASPASIPNPAAAAAVGAIVAGAAPAAAAAIAASPAFAPLTTSTINVDNAYEQPSINMKFQVAEGLDCLLHYNEPFGGDSGFGTGNAYSATSVTFNVDTEDYGGTCSIQFGAGSTEMGDAYFRIIGGGSYQELDGFQSRQSFLDFATAGITSVGGVTNTLGIGTFDVQGESGAFRVGAAYEIPAIALRASVIYTEAYDYTLTGVQNNTGFGATIPGTGVVPITLTTEIPQQIEAKFQTGIREGTLVFANFKWQDWDQLGVIPIVGGISPVAGAASPLSFDPLYQDGFTVTGGVGQVFNEFASGVLALTWDQGTSTIQGAQSDTWTLSGGVKFSEDERFEVSIGGAVGILEGGISRPSPGGDPANDIFYDFDADLVLAASLSAKWRLP